MNERKNVTEKDRKFLDAVAKTGDIQGAAVSAYLSNSKLPSECLQDAEKALCKAGIVEEILGIWKKHGLEFSAGGSSGILKVWDRHGLTLDAAAKAHVKVMKSRRAKKADVLETVKMVYKGRKVPGFAGDGEGAGQAGPTYLQFFIGERDRRGLQVPQILRDAYKEEKDERRNVEGPGDVQLGEGQRIGYEGGDDKGPGGQGG